MQCIYHGNSGLHYVLLSEWPTQFDAPADVDFKLDVVTEMTMR